MDAKGVVIAVEEAARLLRENPKMTYRQAIAKAKEMIFNEKEEKVEKIN